MSARRGEPARHFLPPATKRPRFGDPSSIIPTILCGEASDRFTRNVHAVTCLDCRRHPDFGQHLRAATVASSSGGAR